jgi:hypothetical protein
MDFDPMLGLALLLLLIAGGEDLRRRRRNRERQTRRPQTKVIPLPPRSRSRRPGYPRERKGSRRRPEKTGEAGGP